MLSGQCGEFPGLGTLAETMPGSLVMKSGVELNPGFGTAPRGTWPPSLCQMSFELEQSEREIIYQ